MARDYDLSAREARRMALTAQGFAGTARKGTPAQLRGLIDRLGVVQIDSVNVLTRTHYLPAFSRLEGYQRTSLEKAAWSKRRILFEYWGHEASLMPMEMQPLFRWRMARAAAGDGIWKGIARFARERRDYVDKVRDRIEQGGPVTGGDFADGPKKTPGWWEWSEGKRALEWLFWTGEITTLTRRGFERVYDLTERALPAVADLPTPSEEDAQRELVRIAARAMGVATEADLRDYFRLPLADARARVAELREAGELTPVRVQGWDKTGYLHAEAKARRGGRNVLLSPFDNLIWFRDRTERIFDVKVRLEIYTPPEKRTHGYYVLPFLEGETITARADLKADRQSGALLVQAAHAEPWATKDTPALLMDELKRMALWLGLGRVVIVGKGDLAPKLAGL